MAIDKQTRAEILRLFFAEKWKIGTIARQLGVHHNTVDRIVAEAGVPLQLRGRKPSKLDPFLPFIRKTLAAWPRLPSNRHADLLFNIVSSRSQQNSTIITTNRPFAEWGEAFPNAACLVALVDRLVHNAEILAIDGDSYRRKEAGERQKQRNAERRRRRAAKGGRSAEKAAADPGTS